MRDGGRQVGLDTYVGFCHVMASGYLRGWQLLLSRPLLSVLVFRFRVDKREDVGIAIPLFMAPGNGSAFCAVFKLGLLTGSLIQVPWFAPRSRRAW